MAQVRLQYGGLAAALPTPRPPFCPARCADEGSIPWVPYFRAPYYVWVGRIPKLETLLIENKVGGAGLLPSDGAGPRCLP